MGALEDVHGPKKSTGHSNVETVSVTRSASGSTVVQVTVERGSYRAQWSEKCSVSKVAENTTFARKKALELLAAVRAG